ncbi:LPXTG cell wall anchor domain-containing protein [Streptomyces sp. NBC_00390]|uniref:LPXTG cell wall anchor domain-containing protein n=1 Tax=Streptomyces sp. NBC_00390 TaxID=2975736 RepID=UPI002E1A6FD9
MLRRVRAGWRRRRQAGPDADRPGQAVGQADRPGQARPDPASPTGPGRVTGGNEGGKDPDGDLADTGSDTPVGLIASLATALAAVGGGLVWWKRRHAGTRE